MTSPCRPTPPVCAPPAKTTKCDKYVKGQTNLWVEKGDHPGDDQCDGICLLDTLQPAQVIYVLERDPKARRDLLLVTSDPDLINLANTVPPLPTMEVGDMEQKNINRENNPTSNAFYGIFRGQPPFAQ